MNHPADILAVGVLLLRDWVRELARPVVLQPSVLSGSLPGAATARPLGSILVHVVRLRMFRRHVGHKPFDSSQCSAHSACLQGDDAWPGVAVPQAVAQEPAGLRSPADGEIKPPSTQNELLRRISGRGCT